MTKDVFSVFCEPENLSATTIYDKKELIAQNGKKEKLHMEMKMISPQMHLMLDSEGKKGKI